MAEKIQEENKMLESRYVNLCQNVECIYNSEVRCGHPKPLFDNTGLCHTRAKRVDY